MPVNEELLSLVADIVAAHVSNNSVSTSDVPTLIRTTYEAMAGLGGPVAQEPDEKPEPAVTARKSLANPNHIISMIDGKPYTMLKRHLSQHGLTPAQYRDRFNLPADYPMTARNYSERRRELAHSIGLGRKKDDAPAAVEEVAAQDVPAQDVAVQEEAPAKPERKPRAKKLSGTAALDKVRGDSADA